MSEPLNPWLSRPTTPPPTQAAPVASVPDAFGPVAPQRGIPAPDRVDQLPIHDRGTTAALWWVGAHGGSGESTLAALMPGSQAAGHAWPRTPSPTPARTVLVARGDARGLRAAQDAMRQWAAGLVPSVEVLGLVRCATSCRSSAEASRAPGRCRGSKHGVWGSRRLSHLLRVKFSDLSTN